VVSAYLIPPFRDSLDLQDTEKPPAQITVALAFSRESLTVWGNRSLDRPIKIVPSTKIVNLSESRFDGYRCISTTLDGVDESVPILLAGDWLGIRQRDISELLGSFRARLALPADE
jgi:hypothetical protein